MKQAHYMDDFGGEHLVEILQEGEQTFTGVYVSGNRIGDTVRGNKSRLSEVNEVIDWKQRALDAEAVIREADEYLETNNQTYSSHGSILHRKFKAILSRSK